MPKHLKLDKGKYVDVSDIPYKPFKGVASRDLEAGDTYEAVHPVTKKIVVRQVAEKVILDDGVIIVRSVEVM